MVSDCSKRHVCESGHVCVRDNVTFCLLQRSFCDKYQGNNRPVKLEHFFKRSVLREAAADAANSEMLVSVAKLTSIFAAKKFSLQSGLTGVSATVPVEEVLPLCRGLNPLGDWTECGPVVKSSIRPDAVRLRQKERSKCLSLAIRTGDVDRASSEASVMFRPERFKWVRVAQ